MKRFSYECFQRRARPIRDERDESERAFDSKERMANNEMAGCIESTL